MAWPNFPAGNAEYLPFELDIADPAIFAAVPGFNADAHEPWARILFRFKHPSLSEPFVLAGNISSLGEE